MKNLIFVLAILILGCGTDKEVVEEPTAEDADSKIFVVHEIGPTTKGDHGDPDPPQIINSNIYPQNERVSFNPERLNKEGIFFDFNEDLHRFVVDLSHEGQSLDWIISATRPGNDIGFTITLHPPVGGPFLEHRQEYLINLLVGDNSGDELELEIRFWTVP